MDTSGKLVDVKQDWKSKKILITFELDDRPEEEINRLLGLERLTITAKRYTKKRSVDANAMLWACLKELAEAHNTDKWTMYLKMLKEYGQYTYVCVKPHVVEAVKKQWRECEVVGEVNINGQPSVQMLCYFGSSTYDTKEFSRLLDGVVYEMKESGITPPASKEMKEALELWERRTKE